MHSDQLRSIEARMDRFETLLAESKAAAATTVTAAAPNGPASAPAADVATANVPIAATAVAPVHELPRGMSFRASSRTLSAAGGPVLQAFDEYITIHRESRILCIVVCAVGRRVTIKKIGTEGDGI